MIIKVEKVGITHSCAYCLVCEWTDSLDTMDMGLQDLRKRIKAHVRESGHMITLEVGKTTHYHAR